MKISVFLFLTGIISIYAGNSYSQTTRLSLDLRETTVGEVLTNIENQSEFCFLYSNKLVDVNRKVNLRVKNKHVRNILDRLFADTDVRYVVFDRQIILSPEEMLKKTIEQQNSPPQEIVVKGKVTEEDGNTLPGVNIFVKGTNQGTITDADGNYNIQVDDPNATLVFSFIGYRIQEVDIAGRAVINITLAVEAFGLDEVVTIGYGTQKKINLTGAVGTLETEKIVNVPYANIPQAITGRVPGVFSRQSGGAPGADAPEIRIRGGSNPLIVIDGIIGRDYNTIDPNDIESFNVLKDAAATAVYGARASSGVILITTKRGKKDKPISINYNGSYGWQSPVYLPEKPSIREQLSSHRLAASNMELGDPYPSYTEDIVQIFENGSDPDHYALVNWYDAVNKNAPMTKHNLSLSGGQNNTTYFASLGFLAQDGLYEVSKFDRNNVRANIDQYIPKLKLNIGFDISYDKSVTLNPSTSNEQIWWYIGQLNTEPFPGITTDGRYINTWGLNPFLETTEKRGSRKNIDDNVMLKLAFDWEVPKVDGLKFKVLGAYDNGYPQYKSWSKWPRMYANGDDMVGYITRSPSLTESFSPNHSYTFEAHINYERSFGKHNVNGLLLYSQTESEYHSFSAQKNQYMTSSIDEFYIGESVNQVIDGFSRESGRAGYVGRLQYNYMEKYLIEGNFRYDGSQNFPKEQRWGFFPSVSLGWRISEEPFFQNINSINEFKLRLSYGKTGNDRNAGNFPYLSKYEILGTHIFNGIVEKHISESNIASYAITWETQTSYNAGINLVMFSNRLNFEFDTYLYRTTDILLAVSSDSPTLLGIDFPKSNLGITRRGGFDMDLSYTDNLFHDFTLTIGGSLSYFTSFWEEFNEDPENLKDPNKRITYSNPNAGPMYTDLGLYQSVEEIYNSALWSGTGELRPGDIRYKDINGDGTINSNDQIRQGRGDYPQGLFGFYLNADYKGFNLDAFFQGAFGMEQSFGMGHWGILDYTIAYPNYRETIKDCWTPEHRDAKLPKLGDERSNKLVSTFWSMNNSYVRLKSLTLSYDLKHSLIKTGKIGSVKILLSGTNLFTLQKLYKIFDPEMNSRNVMKYPVMRTVSIGINLTI